MKRLLIGAVMIGGMVGHLAANSIWSPEPPCGRRPEPPGDNGYPSWGHACDPLYAGNNGNGYLAPSVTVAIPQVVAAPPPARPSEPPIRPEVHEYHWPSSHSDSSATAFSIVSKDGRVQSATAVWVQDDALCYVTPDGSESRMPIDSIDRQATRQRNAEKQLNICLPAD
jgi:hypothetical protein